MSNDKQQHLEAEAYRRWENEGRPHGEHDRHWREASDALEKAKTNGRADRKVKTAAQAVPVEKPKRPRAKKPSA